MSLVLFLPVKSSENVEFLFHPHKVLKCSIINISLLIVSILVCNIHKTFILRGTLNSPQSQKQYLKNNMLHIDEMFG